MTRVNHLSRYERRNKRRNNNIQIFLFGGLAAAVFIVLLLSLSSGDKDDDKVANEEQTENVDKNADTTTENEANKADKNNEKADKEEKANNNEDEETPENVEANTTDTYVDRETYAEEISLQRLTTTDQNVDDAYIADWPAIGTKQTGKHTVTYEEGSDDRLEIKKAISYITELEENNIIEHWIGNGGEQKVIATVSDKEMQKHYKVYLSWIKDEGWKPTKLEHLKAVKTEKDEAEANGQPDADAAVEDKTNNEG